MADDKYYTSFATFYHRPHDIIISIIKKRSREDGVIFNARKLFQKKF